MIRNALTGLAASMLLAGAAMAAEPTIGTKLGVGAGEIAAALGAEGYEMTRFTADDGRIEVTAVRDDRRLKLRVDPATGEVVGMESGLRRGAPPQAGIADSEVRAILVAEGYELTSYKRERGEIEAYALKNGRPWEIKIDPVSGRILKIEGED